VAFIYSDTPPGELFKVFKEFHDSMGETTDALMAVSQP
jgi:ribosomal protein L10